MSLLERDRLIRDCWVDSSTSQPAMAAEGPHFAVSVWGIIDDPRYCANGEGPFADIVHWWPALRKFTVTHSCRADVDALDTEVRVTFWQPLPPLPWTS